MLCNKERCIIKAIFVAGGRTEVAISYKKRILKNRPLTGRNVREVDGLFISKIKKGHAKNLLVDNGIKQKPYMDILPAKNNSNI